MNRLIVSFANAVFLKPNLNLCQWSEQYRVLSQEASALFGKFKALQYQIEPMCAITDDQIEEIVLMWGSQLGKSEIINNTIGYYIHQNPSTILFLLPTEDIAEDYSKRRLAPMFRDCKELGALVNDREANNTILIKNFKGGNLALVGSNSASKLASKPIKILLVDEMDRCENTKEGHSIDLAAKRTITYFDRKKILVSTPTIKGSSIIEAEYNLTDKRCYFVPCPFCGFMQILDFEQIHWDKDDKGKAKLDSVGYVCIECGSIWDEIAKNQAVNKGEWRKTNNDIDKNNKKVGFYLNAIYSPFFSLVEIVKSFLESKDKANRLQVFTNTILARSFEPPSIKFEEVELFNRREGYTPTTLSDDILFITAGADIQGDRIEIEFKGFALGFENYGIEHIVLYGDTKSSKVWSEAYAALKKRFITKSGRSMGASICLIDSGYNAERVYSLVRLDNRFFATKGASETNNKIDFINKPKKLQSGVWLYSIGTYKGKSEIFSLLKTQNIGAGYCHYPNSYSLEYFRQLTAEKLTKVKAPNGYDTYRWEKIRERNEALDLSVLCLAGAKILKLDSLDIKRLKNKT